jgi:hypothetical protein
MGTPPVMVDILPRISGVDFDEAWQRRVLVPVDDSLSVPFISREDLLAAKLAAGRPQDLADVAALGAEQTRGALEPPSTAPASSDPMLEAQKRGREDWLKSRQLMGSGADPEETRARARQDWLRHREEQAGSSLPANELPHEQPDQDAPPEERANDRGAGVDDDPES